MTARTGTLEIELLDVDFDAEVPCKMLYLDGTPCTSPAAYRVTAHCSVHGKRGPKMACIMCTGKLIRGDITCGIDCSVLLEYTGSMTL